MRKGLTDLFGATRKDKHSEMEVPLMIYPVEHSDEFYGKDIIINATAVDSHPNAEAGAGAKNTASKLSKLTSSLVAVASSFTKTRQSKEEPQSEGYRPGSTIATQNQELAFDLACRTGDIENFNKIIEQNPDITKIKCNGNFPLITALTNKQSEIATALIENGANPDPRNNGMPLILACQEGYETTVKALIDKEVDLNKATKGGKTGIIAACINNHPKIVEQLIDAGANLNKATADGRTAIIFACANNHPEIVKQLIKAEADLNIGLLPGKTLLQFVCAHGHSEVVKVLIEERPELLHQAHDSEPNPLHIAIENSHDKTVKQLINAGIHLNEEALLYVLSSKFADLFIAKVDVNQPTKDGRALIDIACQNCNTEIVQMLFDAGANVKPGIIEELKYEDKKSELTEQYFKDFIDLIKKISTREAIDMRDKELQNKRQPSSDVTLAGASSALDQAGDRSPR